jgi:exodeoxyribonuclease-3
MKIATWNVNSLKVRLPQVTAWLESSKCDVLALQELKLDNDNFPKDAFTNLGYNCVFNGQKTYNGVAIISKAPITDVVYDIPDFSDPQKRVISARIDGIQIICAYFVNGESVDSQKYLYKLDWCKALHGYMANTISSNKDVILLGDYNIAPHDIDVYDPKLWEGKVLCSDKEREIWHGLLGLGLYDSFRLFNNEDKQYSWWDYRNFAFRRKLGVRIDHILISESLKSASKNCIIDIEPRKNERPSDHTPVVLEL